MPKFNTNKIFKQWLENDDLELDIKKETVNAKGRILRSTYSLAQDLVNVQPMSSPTSLMFALRYYYTEDWWIEELENDKDYDVVDKVTKEEINAQTTI